MVGKHLCYSVYVLNGNLQPIQTHNPQHTVLKNFIVVVTWDWIITVISTHVQNPSFHFMSHNNRTKKVSITTKHINNKITIGTRIQLLEQTQ